MFLSSAGRSISTCTVYNHDSRCEHVQDLDAYAHCVHVHVALLLSYFDRSVCTVGVVGGPPVRVRHLGQRLPLSAVSVDDAVQGRLHVNRMSPRPTFRSKFQGRGACDVVTPFQRNLPPPTSTRRRIATSGPAPMRPNTGCFRAVETRAWLPARPPGRPRFATESASVRAAGARCTHVVGQEGRC